MDTSVSSGHNGETKDKRAIEKQDLKGRDLLTLLIKSNMAGDLEQGERMTEDEMLARESTFLY